MSLAQKYHILHVDQNTYIFFFLVSDYRGWIASPIVTLSLTEKPYPVIFTLQRRFCLDRGKCQEGGFLTAGWNSHIERILTRGVCNLLPIFPSSWNLFEDKAECNLCPVNFLQSVNSKTSISHRVHHLTSSWWLGMSSRALSIGLIVCGPRRL